MKILVVDDDELIVEMARTALAAQGHEILQAATGEEALKTASSALPDLIVLDVGLPGMDGIEVLFRLRGIPSGAHVPVVVLSGRCTREDVMTALSLGAVDYLAKPVAPELLVQRVRRLGAAAAHADSASSQTRAAATGAA